MAEVNPNDAQVSPCPIIRPSRAYAHTGALEATLAHPPKDNC